MADKRLAERDEFYRTFKFDGATMVDLNLCARAPDPICATGLTFRPACPRCGSRLLPSSIEVWQRCRGNELRLTCWCDSCGGSLYTIVLPFTEGLVVDEDGEATPLAEPNVEPWVGVHRAEGATPTQRALSRLEQPDETGER